jgi:hypothetical protein
MSNERLAMVAPVCDFCNRRQVTSLYPTTPFYLTTDREIFPDAPISINDGLPCVSPSDLHPVRGTAEYFGEGWTACDACAALIDTLDHEGLVHRCYNLNYAAASTGPEVFELHHLLFLAFFKHRQGPRLPHPAVSEAT